MTADDVRRIVVISDTHLPRFAHRLPDALARVSAEGPDAIVHCGDFTTLDAAAPFERIAPFYGIAGNNDGPEIVARFGRRRVLALGNYRFGVVHGDGIRGTTLGRARAAFEGEPVDAVLFGHSHIPYLERHAGTLVLNPGSLTDKRRQARYSYAVVDLEPSGLAARIVLFPP